MRLLASVAGICLVACVVACGGGDGPPGPPAKPRPPAKVGEDVSVGGVRWTVLEARDLGQTVRPSGPFGRERTTGGRFVLVKYRVSNDGGGEFRRLSDPVVEDSTGREFRALREQAPYFPPGGREIIQDAVPAGLAREFYAVYEVAPRASGLLLRADANPPDPAQARRLELGL